MQSLALVQGLSGNEYSVDVTDQIADEGEDAQDRNRSATIIFSDPVPSEFSQVMRWRPLEQLIYKNCGPQTMAYTRHL
jgi:hypothetical protein